MSCLTVCCLLEINDDDGGDDDDDDDDDDDEDDISHPCLQRVAALGLLCEKHNENSNRILQKITYLT